LTGGRTISPLVNPLGTNELEVKEVMKRALLVLVILLLAITAFSRNPPQVSTKSLSSNLSNNTKMQKLEQEKNIKASQTKTLNKSSELMLETKDINNTTFSSLPQRAGQLPKTTGTVPHQQIGIDVVPDLNNSLHRWVSSLPDVEIQNSIASLPGATGIWLRKGTAIAEPQVILNGREFTHIHPDGSLHTPLPFERAMEAVGKGWAERHPWADEREGWEGLVMLYTPQTETDLEIVFQLIVESYNFVTGQNEVAADYASE